MSCFGEGGFCQGQGGAAESGPPWPSLRVTGFFWGPQGCSPGSFGQLTPLVGLFRCLRVVCAFWKFLLLSGGAEMPETVFLVRSGSEMARLLIRSAEIFV